MYDVGRGVPRDYTHCRVVPKGEQGHSDAQEALRQLEASKCSHAINH